MNPTAEEQSSAKGSKVKPLELSGLVDSRLQLGYSPKGEKTILFAKGEGDAQSKSFVRSKDIIGNMCKLTILGHTEPRKQAFQLLTGAKNPNSVTSILIPELKNTRVNIWAFDIPSFNTPGHKFFLSNTGVQIIAITMTATWKEDIIAWIRLSKSRSNVYLPTLVVGFPETKKKTNTRVQKEELLASFKKYKVVDLLQIDKVSPVPLNTQLLDGLKSLLSVSPNFIYSNIPMCMTDILTSIAWIKENRIIDLAEFLIIIKMCNSHQGHRVTVDNLEHVTTMHEKGGGGQRLEEEIVTIMDILNNTGVIISFTEASFRDIVILDPDIFFSLLTAVKSVNYTSAPVLTDQLLDSIFADLLVNARKRRMATLILYYFSVIFRQKKGKNWIVPCLLESESFPKVDVGKFREHYMKSRVKYNRIFLFTHLPSSFFSRLYVSVYHRMNTVKMKAWLAEQSGILLWIDDTKEKISILSDSKATVVNYSTKIAQPSTKPPLFFIEVLEIIRDLTHDHFAHCSPQEAVVCTMCLEDSHSFSFHDLLAQYYRSGSDESLNHVSCPMTQETILLKALCPDLGIPHVKELKNFEKLEIIGKGGFGTVRRSKLQDGQEVAIKTPYTFLEKLDQPSNFYEAYKLYYHEVTLIKSQYLHPNLLRQLGIQSWSGELILELVHLGVLGEKLHHSNEHFSDELKFLICADIAKGMKYLHSLTPPIIHRDLRSFNVFVISLDLHAPVNVKIGDFGLSRWCAMPLHEFLPTWQWLAPEIFMCGFYDETSDIYSYGMVLYEIIYRKLPFADMTDFITHVSHEIEPGNVFQYEHYESQGFKIKDNVATREEYKVQEIKEAIFHGLRPSLPSSKDQPLVTNAPTQPTQSNASIPSQPTQPGAGSDANVFSPPPSEVKALIQRCWSNRAFKRPSWLESITTFTRILRKDASIQLEEEEVPADLFNTNNDETSRSEREREEREREKEEGKLERTESNAKIGDLKRNLRKIISLSSSKNNTNTSGSPNVPNPRARSQSVQALTSASREHTPPSSLSSQSSLSHYPPVAPSLALNIASLTFSPSSSPRSSSPRSPSSGGAETTRGEGQDSSLSPFTSPWLSPNTSPWASPSHSPRDLDRLGRDSNNMASGLSAYSSGYLFGSSSRAESLKLSPRSRREMLMTTMLKPADQRGNTSLNFQQMVRSSDSSSQSQTSARSEHSHHSHSHPTRDSLHHHHQAKERANSGVAPSHSDLIRERLENSMSVPHKHRERARSSPSQPAAKLAAQAVQQATKQHPSQFQPISSSVSLSIASGDSSSPDSLPSSNSAPLFTFNPNNHAMGKAMSKSSGAASSTTSPSKKFQRSDRERERERGERESRDSSGSQTDRTESALDKHSRKHSAPNLSASNNLHSSSAPLAMDQSQQSGSARDRERDRSEKETGSSASPKESSPSRQYQSQQHLRPARKMSVTTSPNSSSKRAARTSNSNVAGTLSGPLMSLTSSDPSSSPRHTSDSLSYSTRSSPNFSPPDKRDKGMLSSPDSLSPNNNMTHVAMYNNNNPSPNTNTSSTSHSPSPSPNSAKSNLIANVMNMKSSSSSAQASPRSGSPMSTSSSKQLHSTASSPETPPMGQSEAEQQQQQAQAQQAGANTSPAKRFSHPKPPQGLSALAEESSAQQRDSPPPSHRASTLKKLRSSASRNQRESPRDKEESPRTSGVSSAPQSSSPIVEADSVLANVGNPLSASLEQSSPKTTPRSASFSSVHPNRDSPRLADGGAEGSPRREGDGIHTPPLKDSPRSAHSLNRQLHIRQLMSLSSGGDGSTHVNPSSHHPHSHAQHQHVRMPSPHKRENSGGLERSASANLPIVGNSSPSSSPRIAGSPNLTSSGSNLVSLPPEVITPPPKHRHSLPHQPTQSHGPSDFLTRKGSGGPKTLIPTSQLIMINRATTGSTPHSLSSSPRASPTSSPRASPGRNTPTDPFFLTSMNAVIGHYNNSPGSLAGMSSSPSSSLDTLPDLPDLPDLPRPIQSNVTNEISDAVVIANTGAKRSPDKKPATGGERNSPVNAPTTPTSLSSGSSDTPRTTSKDREKEAGKAVSPIIKREKEREVKLRGRSQSHTPHMKRPHERTSITLPTSPQSTSPTTATTTSTREKKDESSELTSGGEKAASKETLGVLSGKDHQSHASRQGRPRSRPSSGSIDRLADREARESSKERAGREHNKRHSMNEKLTERSSEKLKVESAKGESDSKSVESKERHSPKEKQLPEGTSKSKSPRRTRSHSRDPSSGSEKERERVEKEEKEILEKKEKEEKERIEKEKALSQSSGNLGAATISTSSSGANPASPTLSPSSSSFGARGANLSGSASSGPSRSRSQSLTPLKLKTSFESSLRKVNPLQPLEAILEKTGALKSARGSSGSSTNPFSPSSSASSAGSGGSNSNMNTGGLATANLSQSSAPNKGSEKSSSSTTAVPIEKETTNNTNSKLNSSSSSSVDLHPNSSSAPNPHRTKSSVPLLPLPLASDPPQALQYQTVPSKEQQYQQQQSKSTGFTPHPLSKSHPLPLDRSDASEKEQSQQPQTQQQHKHRRTDRKPQVTQLQSLSTSGNNTNTSGTSDGVDSPSVPVSSPHSKSSSSSPSDPNVDHSASESGQDSLQQTTSSPQIYMNKESYLVHSNSREQRMRSYSKNAKSIMTLSLENSGSDSARAEKRSDATTGTGAPTQPSPHESLSHSSSLLVQTSSDSPRSQSDSTIALGRFPSSPRAISSSGSNKSRVSPARTRYSSGGGPSLLSNSGGGSTSNAQAKSPKPRTSSVPDPYIPGNIALSLPTRERRGSDAASCSSPKNSPKTREDYLKIHSTRDSLSSPRSPGREKVDSSKEIHKKFIVYCERKFASIEKELETLAALTHSFIDFSSATTVVILVAKIKKIIPYCDNVAFETKLIRQQSHDPNKTERFKDLDPLQKLKEIATNSISISVEMLRERIAQLKEEDQLAQNLSTEFTEKINVYMFIKVLKEVHRLINSFEGFNSARLESYESFLNY